MKRETQKTISTWANSTFGEAATTLSVAARANEEMAELIAKLAEDDYHADAAEEAADVIIVLMRVFERLGVDYQKEMSKKMRTNRMRVWKLTGNGHGYHVRGDEVAP